MQHQLFLFYLIRVGRPQGSIPLKYQEWYRNTRTDVHKGLLHSEARAPARGTPLPYTNSLHDRHRRMGGAFLLLTHLANELRSSFAQAECKEDFVLASLRQDERRLAGALASPQTSFWSKVNAYGGYPTIHDVRASRVRYSRDSPLVGVRPFLHQHA